MHADPILKPSKLWSASELWLDPKTPPAESGVYAWYFDQVPDSVPREDCHSVDGLLLLYVGISPSRPGSKAHLRKRLRQHFRGNARGSTLRKTLGCLLEEELTLEFRRMSPRSSRFTPEGEARLSEWMADHARVAWATTPEPWIAEKRLIETTSLPLNLQGNESHPFYRYLKERRSRIVKGAKEKPIRRSAIRGEGQ